MTDENADFIRALFGTPAPPPPPEPDPDAPPEFDGGVREPEPPPSDPQREHAELLAKLIRGEEV